MTRRPGAHAGQQTQAQAQAQAQAHAHAQTQAQQQTQAAAPPDPDSVSLERASKAGGRIPADAESAAQAAGIPENLTDDNL